MKLNLTAAQRHRLGLSGDATAAQVLDAVTERIETDRQSADDALYTAAWGHEKD